MTIFSQATWRDWKEGRVEDWGIFFPIPVLIPDIVTTKGKHV